MFTVSVAFNQITNKRDRPWSYHRYWSHKRRCDYVRPSISFIDKSGSWTTFKTEDTKLTLEDFFLAHHLICSFDTLHFKSVMFGAVEIDQPLRALTAFARGSTWGLTTTIFFSMFFLFCLRWKYIIAISPFPFLYPDLPIYPSLLFQIHNLLIN